MRICKCGNKLSFIGRIQEECYECFLKRVRQENVNEVKQKIEELCIGSSNGKHDFNIEWKRDSGGSLYKEIRCKNPICKLDTKLEYI